MRRSRLRVEDVLRLSAFGLRVRRTRALMSALGIAIGIACIVGVLGVTRSSESDLLGQIDLLGTNLLVVQNGHGFEGQEAELPATATTMIGAMDGVQRVAATARLSNGVYRSELIPTYQGGGLAVRATDLRLLTALDGGLAAGSFLNAATARYPVAVLGWSAARTLGLDRPGAETRVWIGGRYWEVIGILRRLPLAPEVDLSVLVGESSAQSYLGFDGVPTRIYVRAATDRVADVAARLAPTANPQYPYQVSVSRPSDALAARLLAADASTSLFLGLGAIALLIAGVGIANVMLISVLERRSEIGLRRALGATQLHIGAQFMGEAALLALLGGGVGVAAGGGLTAAFAWWHSWTLLMPPSAIVLGLGAALAIGCAAGLYPALRASRLAPTDALRSV